MCSIFDTLYKFLDSTFLQTLVVLGIGIYTIKKAIPDLLFSQKVSRLDRLNYDETLLSAAKSLDSNLSACIHNAGIFTSSCNALQNLAENLQLNGPDLASSLSSFGDNLKLVPSDNSETRKDRIARIFKIEGNTIYYWLTKFEQDTQVFNSVVNGQLEMLRHRLLNMGTNPMGTDALRNELSQSQRETDDYFWLVKRHRKPMNIFSEIVSEIGAVVWTESESWSESKINSAVGAKLKDLGELVRNIFGVYETSTKGVFLSYATRPVNPKRWKIIIDEKLNISATASDDDPEKGAKLIILPHDTRLVELKENGTGYIEYIEKLFN